MALGRGGPQLEPARSPSRRQSDAPTLSPRRLSGAAGEASPAEWCAGAEPSAIEQADGRSLAARSQRPATRRPAVKTFSGLRP